MDKSSFVKGWSQSTLWESESSKKNNCRWWENGQNHWQKMILCVPYTFMTYLASKKQLRLLLSLNRSNEAKMYQEAVGRVVIQLLLLKQIPSHIPFSTILPYAVVSKIAYYETIPKMWNCVLLRLLCQILSNWDVFLWNLKGPSFQFGKLCKLSGKCSRQIMVCHKQSSTFCSMSHQSTKNTINCIYQGKQKHRFSSDNDLIKEQITYLIQLILWMKGLK